MLAMRINSTENFYQDVSIELNNLFDLIKKNDMLLESNGSVANVFVLMPFTGGFFANYQAVIKPVAQEFKCNIKQASEINKADVIIDSVYSEIRQADFLIADATGRNPNVFYEIGYAHALGKK
jgi:nucleoside 2-deoxyribosyltransferase